MRAAVAFVLGLLVAAAIGCGSRDGVIPRGSTGPIKDHLDSVRASLKKKQCSVLPKKIGTVRQDILDLQSRDVPLKLTRNLDDGVDQLSSAAAQECADAAIDDVKTISTQTDTPTETDTPTTDSTPTESVPTDTGDTTDTSTGLTDTGATSTPTQPTGGFEPGPTGAGGPG